MQQTIILHIGRHKSGTSSLQKFFCENESILDELGYYYPKNLRRPIAHHPLAIYFNRNLSDTLNERDHQEIYDFWEEIKDKQNIIISSESFQNIDPLNMKKALGKYNLKIVVYLREQVTYLLSSYAQAIKARKLTLTLEEYENTIFRNVDYFKFIKKWEIAFPNAKMTIRLFEKSLLIEQDIRKDFLVHTGIATKKDLNKFIFIDEDKNPSIGGGLLEFKRLLNTTDYDLKIQMSSLYTILQNMAIKHEKYKLKKSISKEMFNTIKGKYVKSNRMVSELYLDDELKINKNIEFSNQESLNNDNLNEIFLDLEEENKEISDLLKSYYLDILQDKLTLSSSKKI